MSRRSRQRGAALLAMLLILVLGGAWYFVSRLNAASANRTVDVRNQNAIVLARAKQALMGYVAQQAAIAFEDNPGAFLCPEAPSGMTSTTGFDGRTITPNCTPLPAVGRFPWRTIGTEKFVDASGEPLWYVIASGWSKPSASGNTIINSNCTSDATMLCNTGLLTVDGVKDTVALIIAPGPAFNVPAATGCTAWNQVRTIAAGPDFRNYLECENATSPADATFVTTGPSGSFNDQVVKITAAEILPLIEAAVADRFQQEFGKGMRTAYSGGMWPATPVLPYAVPYGGGASSSPATKLQGSAGTLQGLLPGSYSFAGGCTCDAPNTTPCVCSANSQAQRSHEPCDVTDPRCDRSFVAWRSSAGCGAAFCTTVSQVAGATLHSYSCTVAGTPSTLTCTINGWVDLAASLAGNTGMTFNLDAVASNVGMTVRQVSSPTASSRAPQIVGIDSTYAGNGAVSPFGYAITQGTMNTDGSATVRINARFAAGSGSILALLSGLTCDLVNTFCYQYTVSVPMGIVSDHPLVDPTSAYAWFYRNRWQEVSNYAIASGIAPSGARSCTTGTDCLTLAFDPNSGKQRGMLILAGQKIGAQVRPAATTASDLFEGANVSAPFERRSTTLIINRTFNDHFAVIDSN